ncbi:MAG TPA: cyclase family protein [Gaiellaceae bacterium]|nr:cyclase family protein [Gaiellaceae bacterium]
MEIIDISVPIHTEMVVYPGDPAVRLERVESIAEGASANNSKLELGVHSGTHVDAPVHFIDGAAGADRLPLDVLTGPCEVVEVPTLEESAVGAVPQGAERVLFKTPNSELWARESFAETFERLNGPAARRLVERGVRLVGVDYLSVGDHDAHRVLLGAGVVAVEGLDLRNVQPGPYELHCLPLKLVGSDGSPARAILVRR